MSTGEGGGDGVPARDPAQFAVSGGSAFAVNTDALFEAERLLQSAASAVESVSQALSALRWAVFSSACPGLPAHRFHAEATELARTSKVLGEDVRRLAAGTGAAAEAYAAGEARGNAGLWGLQGAARTLIGWPYPALAGSPAPWVPGRITAAGLWAVVSSPPARDLLGDRGPKGSGSDRISVLRRPVVPGKENPATLGYAAQSLKQAQGNAVLEDGSKVPGSSVVLERFQRADGSVAVMVTVPGTQAWPMDESSGNVFDMEGNAHAMAARDSHVRQLIEAALADQQLGQRDAVMFNAYSQGSLHVFGLLEDEGFRRTYPVETVTVFGGTRTAFAVPEDVDVMSVSNVDDPVPALSGVAPAPLPRVVEVVTPAHSDRALLPTIETVPKAHSIDRYVGDARALNASEDDAVRGYSRALGTAVGAKVVGRERFVYTGTDTRAGTAKAPPVPKGAR